MNTSRNMIDGQELVQAVRRVSAVFHARHAYLTELDQAIGDGDLGITIDKAASALDEYSMVDPGEDLGKWLAGVGMAVNRVASSTMGTLLATACMRAGKEIRGKTTLTPADLVVMLVAADAGIQERGKAHLGDKTIVDALHPAAEAFASALESGMGLEQAGERMLEAAREGRDRVTPLQSKMGRSGWVGERTIGVVDGGCEVLVMLLEAVCGVADQASI